MGRVIFSAIIFISAFILLTNNTFSQTEVYKTGDRGIFRYQTAKQAGEKYPEFAIMEKNSGSGIVFGMITPETKITFLNKSLSSKDIDLLEGKEVLVIGTFKEVGKGEGSKIYCKDLQILVIPEGHR